MAEKPELPPGVTVFERGWLSANNILLQGDGPATLIDSGYCTHSGQTLSLVTSALQGRPLDLLLNTHLHSDHCGGNAMLQERYPALRTLIPPGHSEEVRRWDDVALTYGPTGQLCPRFRFDDVLVPGSVLRLGQQDWQVHAAPGHDPHSVILFEPASRTLVSADALWESGFGVVFPEIEGLGAFDEVAATLDLIESLAPRTVIPGHGSVFADVAAALAGARKRLAGFVAHPKRHARHAAKVLLKFKLLEKQAFPNQDFLSWAAGTSYLVQLQQLWEPSSTFDDWLWELVDDLVRAGAALRQPQQIVNT